MRLMTFVIAWLAIPEIFHSLKAQDIEFYQGQYQLIGKFPDSEKTYAGQVTFEAKGDSLEVHRVIDGKECRGTGCLTTVTADKIKALRVVWKEKGSRREILYQINVDWNNYARLTGMYGFDSSSKPGYEALFIAEP